MEPILLEDFIIPPAPAGTGEDANGVHTTIYRGNKLEHIKRLVRRKHVCLKIMKPPHTPGTEYKDTWWGPTDHRGTPLHEAIHIQNIFAHHGLAPRVYKVIEVQVGDERHFAMIVDDCGHMEVKKLIQDDFYHSKIVPLAEKYLITPFNDGREENIVNGKFVDFQGFRLMEGYEEALQGRIRGVAEVGRWGPWSNYQPVLGLKGGRVMEHRIIKLNLEKMNFEGKSFIDIGCSEGLFCHYAEAHGAAHIVGVDLPGVTENLWELASYLGYYNCDFLGLDLTKEEPKGTFDIVFFLSMGAHIGFPAWVIQKTRELLVYEGNSRSADTIHMDEIKSTMSVIYEGRTSDLFKREIIWAQKK